MSQLHDWADPITCRYGFEATPMTLHTGDRQFSHGDTFLVRSCRRCGIPQFELGDGLGWRYDHDEFGIWPVAQRLSTEQLDDCSLVIINQVLTR